MRPAAVLALATVLATAAVAYNNGAGATPPMGWNTWCTDDVCGLIDKCSDAEVRQQADALVASGMHALGYEYVNMDDCWNDKTRNATGHLQPNPTRFPYGMKALADYVHSKGLKIGLYTSIGSWTCKNHLPGSYGHYDKDAQTFAEWGIDFVKCDNCAKPGNVLERTLYANFSSYLNATGRQILFSLCEWGDQDVQRWGAQVGQMYRIQMDHLPLYNFPFHTALGKGFGQGVINIIDYIGTLTPSSFVKQYGWMDPDFLMTLFWPSMSVKYSRMELTMWTAWSAPMIVATNVYNMSAEKKALLMNPEVIAIDQDPSNTAADRIFNTSDGGQVWSRPLANGDAAVVLLNGNDYLFSKTSVTLTANWTRVGITGNVTKVRDMWARADLPASAWTAQGYTVTLPPTEVSYVRVTCSSRCM